MQIVSLPYLSGRLSFDSNILNSQEPNNLWIEKRHLQGFFDLEAKKIGELFLWLSLKLFFANAVQTKSFPLVYLHANCNLFRLFAQTISRVYSSYLWRVKGKCTNESRKPANFGPNSAENVQKLLSKKNGKASNFKQTILFFISFHQFNLQKKKHIFKLFFCRKKNSRTEKWRKSQQSSVFFSLFKLLKQTWQLLLLLVPGFLGTRVQFCAVQSTFTWS